MTKLKLYWLGPPTVELDGRPLQLEMRKTLALLAYLSLSPQSPTRETLAALFWPEFDQQHALANLRRNLSSLVMSMPSNLLQIDRERVGLRRDEGIQVDVEQFRGLLAQANAHTHSSEQVCLECLSVIEKAVEIYRGDFFKGFNLKDSPEFDDWQFFQREGLRSEYAGALEKLAVYYKETCEWEKAIAHARSWLALDRLNELAHQMLIRLYYLSGQKSTALRQYEECERILEQELGQPPDPETHKVYEEIRSGSPVDEPGVSKRVSLAAGTVSPEVHIIKTKLFIPKVQRMVVERPRLVALLNMGLQMPLTVLSASAGFGKTTLLADWASQTDLQTAWIGLDSRDNDPHRLVAYIVSAIRNILPGSSAGKEALEMLCSPSPLPIEWILSSFINDLIQLKNHIVLVLDDYHLIQNKDAHLVIDFLLEHQPDMLHLVLSTRVDPPLSLARMRANHQMLEIRTEDLRFTSTEARIFLNEMMGLDITDNDITTLNERTEGWIAGFKMVSIVLQQHASSINPQSKHDFIRTLSGSHRYILDYLVEEVLNNQPASIRTFLTRTSILDRFCASLCEAVAGPFETGDTPQTIIEPAFQVAGTNIYQQILEYLDRANMFLIPLDEERCWYRYHHLFADLLKARLIQGEKENIRELHLLAADWLEKNGLPMDAFGHANETKDYDRMARLVESNYLNAWEWNELNSIHMWMRQIPHGFVLKRPKLCTYHAFLEMLSGRLEGLDAYVEAAETGLEAEIPSQEKEETLGLLNLIRAYLCGSRGDWSKAIELARRPISPFPRYSPACSNMLGLAYFMEGDFDSAYTAWDTSIKDDIFYYAGTIALATSSMGRALKHQGRLREAEKRYKETLETISLRGSQRFFNPALVYFGMADLLREKNDLDQALQHIHEGIKSSSHWFPANSVASGYGTWGKILASKGEHEAAQNVFHEADQKLQGQTLFPHMQSDIETSKVHAWLAAGNFQPARNWLEEHKSILEIPDGETPGLSFRREYDRVYAIRVLLVQGRFHEALQLASEMLKIAENGERTGRVIEIGILQAIALKGLGYTEEALKALDNSLRLAQPEGYMRIFLDEGMPLKNLLLEGKHRGKWQDPWMGVYVDKLLV